MIKALLYLLLSLTPFSFLNASVLSDCSFIVKNQVDSIAKNTVTLVEEAKNVAYEKPLDAIKKYRLALAANNIKDEVSEANIRLAIGKLLYKVKDSQAIPELLKADALYKKNSHWVGRGDALAAIITIYELGGSFANAVNYYDVLYKVQFESGEAFAAGNTASYLTDVFISKKDYPKAFKYADMAKTAYYRICNKDSLGAVYYKIAYLKGKQKSYKSSEYYILSQALPYYRSADNVEGRLKSFDFLGHLYQDQTKYSQAKWFFLQANNQARLANDTAGIISSLINLSVVKILIGDTALAKKDLKEAELLSKNENFAYLLKNAKIKYATIFKKLNPELVAINTLEPPATIKTLISNKTIPTPKVKKEKDTALKIQD